MPFTLSAGGANEGGMNFNLGTPITVSNTTLNAGAVSVLHSIDTDAPLGYNATFNSTLFTTLSATVALSGAEIGSTYTLRVDSSRHGTTTINGTVTSENQSINVDRSFLS